MKPLLRQRSQRNEVSGEHVEREVVFHHDDIVSISGELDIVVR